MKKILALVLTSCSSHCMSTELEISNEHFKLETKIAELLDNQDVKDELSSKSDYLTYLSLFTEMPEIANDDLYEIIGERLPLIKDIASIIEDYAQWNLVYTLNLQNETALLEMDEKIQLFSLPVETPPQERIQLSKAYFEAYFKKIEQSSGEDLMKMKYSAVKKSASAILNALVAQGVISKK